MTILLQDAFLSVFTWMAVEAIHLYRMVVLVFGAERDLKYAYLAVGWGNYPNVFSLNLSSACADMFLVLVIMARTIFECCIW